MKKKENIALFLDYFFFRFVGSDNPETYFKDTERTRVVSSNFAFKWEKLGQMFSQSLIFGEHKPN